MGRYPQLHLRQNDEDGNGDDDDANDGDDAIGRDEAVGKVGEVAS